MPLTPLTIRDRMLVKRVDGTAPVGINVGRVSGDGRPCLIDNVGEVRVDSIRGRQTACYFAKPSELEEVKI